MKKLLYTLLLTLTAIAIGCSDYDDSALSNRLDDFKDRIAKLQKSITSLNDQLSDLSALTNGNVITSFAQDSDGNYVITYKNSKDETKSVVVATIDQMINVPLLGVELDANGIYYWTATIDGETSRLKDKADADIPVSGYTPVVAVDSEGYWTVEGVRINDASGRPIEARDGESCLFKGVERDEAGNLALTLGNGSTITLPVQQVLNLSLSAAINTTVVNATQPLEVSYTLSGEHANDALIGIAEAEGIKASLDKSTQKVTVTFPAGFTSGHLILVAYDMQENTVIRPVFFAASKSDRIEIRTADELVQFAADVNAANGAQSMKVLLMNDINMADVTTWTPIGNGTFAGITAGTDHISSYMGASFQGTFDGQGYKLRNLKMEATLSGDGAIYGLFGILDGATVSNLTLGDETDDSSVLKVSGTGTTDTGVIAGVCFGSTIQDCTSYVAMNCLGTTAASLRMTMGLVGFVYGGTTEETVSNLLRLKNYGSIEGVAGSNGGNGATSVQIGGIAGFSNVAKASTYKNTFSECVNYGEMTSGTARTSGIVAAANLHTLIQNCDNRGKQTNNYSLSGGGRPANITCVMGPGCVVDGCTNYGDLICTNKATQAGGLICLLNDNSVEVVNSANYGNIITDLTTFRGTLVANFSKFAKFDNNTAGGGLGSYNGGTYQMVDITEANYMTYIGKYADTSLPKITNTIYAGTGATAKGIRTATDLVAFAAAINAGASIDEWLNEDGEVCLLRDIDMKEVTTWTPIGKGTYTVAINKITLTGTPYTGHFNGQGRHISNLKLLSDGSTAGEAYGFFGIVGKGAVIENFIFDASCSLTVTATASASSGVVAGLVCDGTIRDITSNAPMLFQGQSKAHMGMAMIGYAFANTTDVTIDSVDNLGKMTAENKDSNTTGGGSGYHIAGIVGFATNDATSEKNVLITSCSNYGDMISATGRTSGIVAAANRYTTVSNCHNYGNQINSNPKDGDGRLGMITCNTGTGSKLSNCSNYGNLTSTTKGRCGGITSLSGTASFENCANYGTILTDDTNRGLFWGYNNGAATWTSCTAGGKVGTYNGGEPVYDSYAEADQATYLGAQGTTKSILTGIVYKIGSTGGNSDSGDAELRILLIGNSFTKDAVEHLPGLLKAAGLEKVKLTHMYYGGRTVPEYNNGFTTTADYHCYQCNPGSEVWSDTPSKTLAEVAASDHWDIVTIQEHTGKVNAWEWTSTEKNALQGLINNVKATQTGAMPKFYYIMSQAYGDPAILSYSQQTVIVNNFSSSQSAMYSTIVAQAQKVMSEVLFDDVIATGTMVQNLRTSSLENTMDMTRDGYHMDFGITRYGAACMLFEKLISPAFENIKLDQNTYRTTTSDTTPGNYTTPITSDNAPIALQAARYALTTPYAVTDMSK